MADVARGLAALRVGDDGAQVVDFLVELTRDEYNRAVEAAGAVDHALRLNTVALVDSAYDTLTTTLSFHGHMASSPAASSRVLAEVARPGMASQLFAWLSAGRLFLDQSRTLLSRTFNAESPEVQRFTRATKWAWDHSLAYRFTYKLRDAYQHVGVPSINVAMRRQDGSDSRELRMIGDRNGLLAEFDGWKSRVRTDLQSLPAEFEVDTLVGAAMLQHQFLAAQVKACFRQRAKRGASLLQYLLQRAGDQQGDVTLATRINESPDRLRLKLGPSFRAEDLPRVLSMKDAPEGPEMVHLCIGALPTSQACQRKAPSLIAAPENRGMAFIPVCDLHQRSAARHVMRLLGAASPLHASLLDCMRVGMEEAGRATRVLTNIEDVSGMEKSSEWLPPLDPLFSPSGWHRPQHPELAKRSRRAIDAMAAWYREKGGTPAFFDDLNAIIAADNGIEPLLVGLINMNATLLAFVSTALGRSPATVLGGLAQDLDTMIVPPSPGSHDPE